jgi:hypothetical protein
MPATTLFNKQLLSATAPALGATSPTNLGYTLSGLCITLSSFDVVIDTLSAGANGNVVGLVYNALHLVTSSSKLSSATFAGHSFRIAVGYHLQEFGILYSDRTVTTFTYLSTVIAQTLLSANNTAEVFYPDKRRLKLMGYI